MTDQDEIYAPHVQPRGPAYRDDQVASCSHCNDPLEVINPDADLLGIASVAQKKS
ncbi:hypothetical protein [Luteibacter sp. 22Crub2.1]|uniref:hypothetical protein n=1 Tax=Luteibacter sp. 22Crub2.1 TaxID=1283288 RepID=UPI0009CEF65A|nr:hypothetical protein [Luteibacter sp. 22Crub2.1]SKB95957.1 hypothetical protein SAMN05660880_03437 [Luteibacter sp. 22Crub2.1]